jgi:GPH family glycoside/pentoside/hexuronide:cation symporter
MTKTPRADPHEKLSFFEKFSYGLGDTASNFVWATLMSFLTYYYTDIFGLPATAMAALFLFTRFLDGVSDIAIGAVADRTESKAGKFRPYLLWMSVPLAVTFVLTFTTPPWSLGAKIVYAWITYNLMMLAYTAINIPYSALSGVMTADTQQRASLNAFRMTLAMTGGFLINAMTLPMINALGQGNNQRGYFLTACCFGAVIVALFGITYFGTRERITPPPEQRGKLFEDFRLLFRNRPWIILFAVAIMNMIFIVVRGSVTVHFYKYVMLLAEPEPHFLIGGLKLHKISTIMSLGSICFIIGAVLTPRLVGHISKRLLFIQTFVINALTAVPLMFLGPDDLSLVLTLQAVGSITGGVNATLFWTMIADAADYGEKVLGRRTTGIVFSATTAAQKLGMGLGGALIGWMLNRIGYVPNVEQTPQAIEGLKALMSWIPALGFLACALILLAYPIGRKPNE